MKVLSSQRKPADNPSAKLATDGPTAKNHNDRGNNIDANNKKNLQEKNRMFLLKATVQETMDNNNNNKTTSMTPTIVMSTTKSMPNTTRPLETTNGTPSPKFAHYNDLDLGPVQQDVVDDDFHVGPYKLESLLGKGSFASVLLARHGESCYSCALKRIEKQQDLPQRDLDNLEREIKATQMVHHRNIVRCHEVIHTPRNIYLVMDLGYRDLFDYFRKDIGGPVPTRVLREITLGLIKGMAYLHSIGVAHLDMKPENVLISKNVKPWDLTSKDVRLCDFGLCEIARDGDRAGPIRVDGCRGTAGFACPEMVMHRACEGRQADMWAVGVTLLDVTDRVPRGWMELQKSKRFERRLSAMLDMIQCRDHFEDANIHNLVNNLLRWNPEDRLTAKQALQHSWFYEDSTHRDANHRMARDGGWLKWRQTVVTR